MSTPTQVVSSGVLSIPPNTLLVYLDETGDEGLSDPSHPVFGIGGCALISNFSGRLLEAPWHAFKAEAFGTESHAFHATASMRQATDEQRGALNQFFKDSLFSRFAAVMRSDTTISDEVTAFKVVAISVMRRLEEISQIYSFDSVALIFEDTQRARRLIEANFSTMRMERDGAQIPVHGYFAAKSAGEAGLEIADAIINTAGRHVRHGMRTGTREALEIFDAIFRSVPKPLVTYIEIDSAIVQSRP